MVDSSPSARNLDVDVARVTHVPGVGRLSGTRGVAKRQGSHTRDLNWRQCATMLDILSIISKDLAQSLVSSD